MQRIRTAVIGAGRLGGFHAQKLNLHPQAELVGVVDPFAMSRNRVATECGCQAFAHYRELYGKIDAAVVAAPTCRHFEIAKELLDNGIHLLVEKPLCTQTSEADALVELAREKNRVLQVGHVERFNPAFQAAVGEFKEPKYIEAVRTSGFTFRSTDIGAVLDIMIHDIDLVLSMVRSPVRRVEALGMSVLGGHEDTANARIVFENGCVATLSASRVSYESLRRMHLWSHDGFASIDFGARKTNIVRPSETLLAREFDVDQLSPEAVERFRKTFAEEHLPRIEKQYDAVDALELEVQDFVQAVLHGDSPRVTGQDGRNAIALAEEILDRIHYHSWDGTLDGPVGPLAIPRRHIIPAPHFNVPDQSPLRHREAG